MFRFSLQLLSEIFLILRRIGIQIKHPLFLSDIIYIWNFPTYSTNARISSVMKIGPVEVELLHAEELKDRREEDSSHIS